MEPLSLLLKCRLSGTPHQHIDEYSRRRIEQISEELTAVISKIVTDAKIRSAGVEEEYKLKLKSNVEELDAAKTQNLSVLEKDFNLRQEMILEQARKRIDDLNEEANRLKMSVLRDAEAQANA